MACPLWKPSVAVALLPGLFYGATGIRSLGLLTSWYLFRVQDRHVSPSEEFGGFLYLLLFVSLPIQLPVAHCLGRFLRYCVTVATQERQLDAGTRCIVLFAGASTLYLSWISWVFTWSGFTVLSASPSAWLAWIQAWAGPIRWYVLLLWLVEAGALMYGTMNDDEERL